MKLYTRRGDEGETALFGGGRVRKDHPRVEAYGEVDELCAAIGLAIVPLEAVRAEVVVGELRSIQEDLFAIGAHLATPGEGTRGASAARHLPPLPEERVDEMEAWMDAAEDRLPPLKSFVLPGGTDASARLHVARAVCRRAERRVLSLAREDPIDPVILAYLNRLSDLLFTLARVANFEAGRDDVPWSGRSL